MIVSHQHYFPPCAPLLSSLFHLVILFLFPNLSTFLLYCFTFLTCQHINGIPISLSCTDFSAKKCEQTTQHGKHHTCSTSACQRGKHSFTERLAAVLRVKGSVTSAPAEVKYIRTAFQAEFNLRGTLTCEFTLLTSCKVS